MFFTDHIPKETCQERTACRPLLTNGGAVTAPAALPSTASRSGWSFQIPAHGTQGWRLSAAPILRLHAGAVFATIDQADVPSRGQRSQPYRQPTPAPSGLNHGPPLWCV